MRVPLGLGEELAVHEQSDQAVVKADDVMVPDFVGYIEGNGQGLGGVGSVAGEHELAGGGGQADAVAAVVAVGEDAVLAGFALDLDPGRDGHLLEMGHAHGGAGSEVIGRVDQLRAVADDAGATGTVGIGTQVEAAHVVGVLAADQVRILKAPVAYGLGQGAVIQGERGGHEFDADAFDQAGVDGGDAEIVTGHGLETIGGITGGGFGQLGHENAVLVKAIALQVAGGGAGPGQVDVVGETGGAEVGDVGGGHEVEPVARVTLTGVVDIVEQANLIGIEGLVPDRELVHLVAEVGFTAKYFFAEPQIGVLNLGQCLDRPGRLSDLTAVDVEGRETLVEGRGDMEPGVVGIAAAGDGIARAWCVGFECQALRTFGDEAEGFAALVAEVEQRGIRAGGVDLEPAGDGELVVEDEALSATDIHGAKQGMAKGAGEGTTRHFETGVATHDVGEGGLVEGPVGDRRGEVAWGRQGDGLDGDGCAFVVVVIERGNGKRVLDGGAQLIEGERQGGGVDRQGGEGVAIKVEAIASQIALTVGGGGPGVLQALNLGDDGDVGGRFGLADVDRVAGLDGVVELCHLGIFEGDREDHDLVDKAFVVFVGAGLVHAHGKVATAGEREAGEGCGGAGLELAVEVQLGLALVKADGELVPAVEADGAGVELEGVGGARGALEGGVVAVKGEGITFRAVLAIAEDGGAFDILGGIDPGHQGELIGLIEQGMGIDPDVIVHAVEGEGLAQLAGLARRDPVLESAIQAVADIAGRELAAVGFVAGPVGDQLWEGRRHGGRDGEVHGCAVGQARDVGDREVESYLGAGCHGRCDEVEAQAAAAEVRGKILMKRDAGEGDVDRL